MGIEPISKTLQMFLAEALEHASPYFPTLKLLVSEFSGFLFATLWILLLEKVILITSIGLKGNLSFISLHQWVINPY